MPGLIKKLEIKKQQNLKNALQKYIDTYKEKKFVLFKASNKNNFNKSKGKKIVNIIVLIQIILFIFIFALFLISIYLKTNGFLRIILILILFIIASLVIYDTFFKEDKWIDTIYFDEANLKVTLLNKNLESIKDAKVNNYSLPIKINTKSGNNNLLDILYYVTIWQNGKHNYFIALNNVSKEIEFLAFFIFIQAKINKINLADLSDLELKKLKRKIIKGKIKNRG